MRHWDFSVWLEERFHSADGEDFDQLADDIAEKLEIEWDDAMPPGPWVINVDELNNWARVFDANEEIILDDIGELSQGRNAILFALVDAYNRAHHHDG